MKKIIEKIKKKKYQNIIITIIAILIITTAGININAILKKKSNKININNNEVNMKKEFKKRMDNIKKNTQEKKWMPKENEWIPEENEKIWEYIVIHHSATKAGSKKAFDKYHREKRKMENGFAYHFLIGNGMGTEDGKIEVGERWKKQIQGGHLRANKNQLDLNYQAIGIVLVGDFTKEIPTEKQLKALKKLVIFLKEKYKIKIENIQGHKNMPHQKTICPGNLFFTEIFIQEIK